MVDEARTDPVCNLCVACLVDLCLTGTGSGTRAVIVDEGCSARLLGELMIHWTVSIRVTSNATIVVHVDKARMKSCVHLRGMECSVVRCSLHESSLVILCPLYLPSRRAEASPSQAHLQRTLRAHGNFAFFDDPVLDISCRHWGDMLDRMSEG